MKYYKWLIDGFEWSIHDSSPLTAIVYIFSGLIISILSIGEFYKWDVDWGNVRLIVIAIIIMNLNTMYLHSINDTKEKK